MTAKKVKVCLVGDGACGKTCMLAAFRGLVFHSGKPSSVESHQFPMTGGRFEEFILEVIDTPGQKNLGDIRRLAYFGCNVFILCYALTHEYTAENLGDYWIPEVREVVPNAFFIVVGCKSDVPKPPDCSNIEVQETLKYLGKFSYHKSSALEGMQGRDNGNIKNIFLLAARHAYDIQYKPKGQDGSGKILAAIRSGTKIPYSRLKLMYIGRGQAGKTSSINCLIGKPKDITSSTIVVENKLDLSVYDVERWKPQTCPDGHHLLASEFTRISSPFLENAPAPATTELPKFVENGAKYKLELIHKTELSQQVKTARKRNNIISKLKKNFFARTQLTKHENATKEEDDGSLKFTIWDFGGQEVFHSVHHLYLTNGGVYVIAVNGLEVVQNWTDARRDLEYWLRSVQVHAAQCTVAIIATRWKAVLTEKAEKEVYARVQDVVDQVEIWDKLLQNRDYKALFPIENKDARMNGPLLSDLKSALYGKATDENARDLWNQEINLSWSFFFTFLVNKHKDYISDEEVFEEGRSFGMDGDELKMFLNFYSKAGAIILFLDANEKILNPIILRPQWLLEVLATFIYDAELHRRLKSLNENIRNEIAQYERTGLIPLGILMELILARSNVSEKDADMVLDICRHSFLISDLLVTNPDCKEYVCVAAMINTVAGIEFIPRAETLHNFYIRADKCMTTGVFERILCLFLTESNLIDGGRPSELKKSKARISLRNTDVYIENNESFDEIKISVLKGEKVIHDVLSITENILDALSKDDFGRRVKCQVLLESVNGLRCKREAILLPGSYVTTIDKRQEKRKAFRHFLPAVPLELDQKTNFKFDIFLSHDWGPGQVNHLKALNIAKRLEAENITVWLDEKNLTTNVAQDITDGIDQSCCVLMLITKNYLLRSKAQLNIASEVDYAVRNRTVIPVVVESSCLDQATWNGTPVGLRVGRFLYHNLCDESSPEQYEKEFQNLCTRIRNEVAKTFE